MESSKLPVATVAAFLSFSIAACVAQEATTTTDSSTTAQDSAQSNAIIERYMTSVPIELSTKVDSRNAAAGQEVTAKTRETAKLADGTTLPRGTRLVGHVIRAQAATQDQPYAMLAIAFDRAELKYGQSVALRSAIRTVAPPATPAPDSMMANQQGGPMGAGASAGGMGSGSGRGGLGAGGGGGAAGGPVRGVGQTTGGGVGQTAGGIARTAGGVGNTTGTTLGGATTDPRSLPQAAPSVPGGVVAQAGETISVAPRATALPGVMLATSGSANASGTLVASGRNISLEAGTQITLGLITR